MDASAKTFPEKMDFEAFLAFLDAHPSEKWELYDGVPVAMAGGTRVHSLLKGNSFSALRSLALGRGCEAHDGDLLVRSPVEGAFSAFPDVFVRCGQLPDCREVSDPLIIVEVLSPSTMADDRGYKFQRYREIPTVQQILLIYADQRRVESWNRGSDEWTLLAYDAGAVPIRALDAALLVDDVYAGVDLARTAEA